MVTAYQIEESEGDDAILTPVGEQLTPEIIDDNNLLVMELTLLEEFDGSSGDNGGSGSSGGGSSTKNLLLDKMKIKDLKESWPFRSEISIKVFKLENISSNQTYECGLSVKASVNCYTDTGNRILTLKRKWKNDNRTYNWHIETSDINSNDVVFYVLFEADVFPAPTKEEYVSIGNGSSSRITYRSWQNIYDKEAVSLNYNNTYGNPYAYSFSENNSVIQYNLK